MRLATAIAPVAASGNPFASNDTNHVSPLLSVIVNPGANPVVFGLTTAHLPAAGPLPVSGPRTASSTESGRARIRLVNQLESGTSSIVLMLPAATFDALSPGRLNRFSARSQNRSMSHGCTADAF